MSTLVPVAPLGLRFGDEPVGAPGQRRARLSARAATGAIGFFTALTAILTYPLSVYPGSHALDLGADTRLFLWTLSWDIHALVAKPFSLFQANIFYPQSDTLAYSEHLMGSALLAAPWLAATGNPILAMNAVVLLTCAGAGVGAYFLARRIGIGTAGALAAGVVFAFAPPRFFRLGQLHLANVMWMPLCLAFLHRYARRGERRHLLAACALFTIQALSGGQIGLFLLMASVAWLVYARAVGLLTKPRTKLLVDLGMAGAVLVALNAPFLAPYLRVQREEGLRRSLDEAREWSPNAASFLAAPTHAQRMILGLDPKLERRVLGAANTYLFPGFVTLLLAGLSLRRARDRSPPSLDRTRSSPAPAWVTWLDTALLATALVALLLWATGGIRLHLGSVTVSARGPERAIIVLAVLLLVRFAAARTIPFRFTAPYRRLVDFGRRELEARMGVEAGFYLLLAFFSLWISLGPAFGLYSALHRIVPGFDFIRVPSRFSLLTVLGLSVLAGVGLERCLARMRSNRKRWLAIATIGILVVEFAAFPLDAPAYALDIPSVDRWIAERARAEGPFALVELPVPDPRDSAQAARWHSIFMIHSTAHWQRIVNGYSGFTPPEQDALFRKLANFPDSASLDALEQLGVSYAVIHHAGYDRAAWEAVEAKLEGYRDRLRLETSEDGDAVYSLTRRVDSLSDRGS